MRSEFSHIPLAETIMSEDKRDFVLVGSWPVGTWAFYARNSGG